MQKQIIAIWLFLSALPPADAEELQSVSKAYANRDYSLCLKLVEAAPTASRKPGDEYYQALCLQALRRYDEAAVVYGKLSKQKKDTRIAGLAAQGLQGLSRKPTLPSRAGTSESKVVSSATKAGYVEDQQWKIQQPGFGGQGENRAGMPEGWTFKKTSNGCGRHH